MLLRALPAANTTQKTLNKKQFSFSFEISSLMAYAEASVLFRERVLLARRPVTVVFYDLLVAMRTAKQELSARWGGFQVGGYKGRFSR